ncbi:helix-turn-helix domain-containing protein [Streptomyces sp. NPDC052225]|uniref:TetR/AcrR family transcriptional regulator n=1 Tax=Streptomyces sp. NPDC052225 TaxID=3154949 RepID=UPI00342169E9
MARRQQTRQEWATRTARDRTDAPARGRLLDAAEEVFGRLGHGPTTIADITARAEISRAGFYVYFASKDEVFRVLAARVRDAFLAAQDVPGIDTDDVAAVTEASTGAFIAAYARHLPLLTLVEQQARTDDEVRALWEEIRERPVRRAARYVRRVAAEGRARPVVDPLTLSRAVGGMSVEFARLVAEHPDTYDTAVRDVSAMYRHLLGLGHTPERRDTDTDAGGAVLSPPDRSGGRS